MTIHHVTRPEGPRSRPSRLSERLQARVNQSWLDPSEVRKAERLPSRLSEVRRAERTRTGLVDDPTTTQGAPSARSEITPAELSEARRSARRAEGAPVWPRRSEGP